MSGGESGDPDDEPDRDEWDEAVCRTESYETDEGDLVVYDSKNPMAWIKGSYFGTPIDILEPVGKTDDIDGADEDAGGS